MDEGREVRYGRGTRACGRFIRSRDRGHGSRRDEERRGETRREEKRSGPWCSRVRAVWYELWSGRRVRRLLQRRCATRHRRATTREGQAMLYVQQAIILVYPKPSITVSVQYSISTVQSRIRRRRCWGLCLGPSLWQRGLNGGERRDRSGRYQGHPSRIEET